MSQTNYRLEIRIVDAATGKSVSGVQSSPFTKDFLDSDRVNTLASNHLMTVIGNARISEMSKPSVDQHAPLDPQSAAHLRSLANLIDAGRFVASVVSRKFLGDTIQELTIILDQRKGA